MSEISEKENPIAVAITEALGGRCTDFDAECMTCKAWKQYDDLRAAAHARAEAAGVKLLERFVRVFQTGYSRDAFARRDYDDVAADAAIFLQRHRKQGDALAHPAVPEGMVMVPREPTEAMLQAACDATFGPAMRTHEENHRLGWRAMIAAAEKEGNNG